jgi:hypothetical protein
MDQTQCGRKIRQIAVRTRISGIIVPKSPREPASSERENFIGIMDSGGTVIG